MRGLSCSYRRGGFIVNYIVNNLIDDHIVDEAQDLNWAMVSEFNGRGRAQILRL
jgi:hypothetical protein